MAKPITLLNKNPMLLNTNSPKGDILQSLTGIKNDVNNVKTDVIKTEEPFISLFQIKQEVLAAITADMQKNGYDKAYPVIIWKEKNILIDGHTRLKAAKTAGISSIPALYVSFESEEAALDYMNRIQFNRRNITDSDLIQLVVNALPQYEKKYGEGSKADFLVKRYTGLSETKAKQCIVVAEKADSADIEAIKTGEKTINQIYNKYKRDRNNNKKVRIDFFDDGNKEFIRTDDNGTFYLRNYKTMKEIKAFSLPKALNSEKIRKRIKEVIEEEMGKR